MDNDMANKVGQHMLSTNRDIVAGNVYDKYNSPNPIYRWLVSRYFECLTDMLGKTQPATVLEVGCGEGHMSEFAHVQLDKPAVAALDISHDIVIKAHQTYPHITFVSGNAYKLPFQDHRFDLVLALESLEHMHLAELALGEIRRVAKRDVIVSVPQEPIWRVLNLARGAYITQTGNTPGHVRHWSPHGIEELLRSYLNVLEFRTPFPWSMAWCRVD